MIESPCVKICKLNSYEICTGCGRHIDEVARWRHLTADEKKLVWDIAKHRMKTMVERKTDDQDF